MDRSEGMQQKVGKREERIDKDGSTRASALEGSEVIKGSDAAWRCYKP